MNVVKIQTKILGNADEARNGGGGLELQGPTRTGNVLIMKQRLLPDTEISWCGPVAEQLARWTWRLLFPAVPLDCV